MAALCMSDAVLSTRAPETLARFCADDGTPVNGKELDLSWLRPHLEPGPTPPMDKRVFQVTLPLEAVKAAGVTHPAQAMHPLKVSRLLVRHILPLEMERFIALRSKDCRRPSRIFRWLPKPSACRHTQNWCCLLWQQ